eukprot:10994409-Karenia_brevis.AAC.1
MGRGIAKAKAGHTNKSPGHHCSTNGNNCKLVSRPRGLPPDQTNTSHQVLKEHHRPSQTKKIERHSRATGGRQNHPAGADLSRAVPF